MSRKTFFFLLLVALLVYGLSRLLWHGEGTGLIRTELTKVDTSKLDYLVIRRAGESFSLKREPEGWIASKGPLNLPAMQVQVNELLGALSGVVRTNAIVSQNPETWPQYGVDEAHGVRVRLYYRNELVEDFIVGKAGFMRFGGEQEVYEIEGLSPEMIGRSFNTYRNHEILKLKANEQISAFEWQLPDTLLYFSKTDHRWFCNETVALDSLKVKRYLDGLRNVNALTFADDFDEVEAERYAFRTLKLSGDNLETDYFIECYRDTLRKPPYIFRSSSQPEVFFEEDSTGLYRRLFKELNDLINETARQ